MERCSVRQVVKKKTDTKPNPEMVSMERRLVRQVIKKKLTPNVTRKWLVWNGVQ